MLMMSVVDATLQAVLYVVPFVVVLMTIVFVHELGHFLAARWCGIRVKAFSLGFGREIWGFTDRHGTRWRLSPIPLGGYVNFFDEGATGAADASSQGASPATGGFRTAPLRHRVVVVAAGPIANFLFTIVICAGLGLVVGSRDFGPRIGLVEAASPAAAAGLRAGDVVTAFGSGSVSSWRDIERLLAENADRRTTLEITRDGQPLTLEVKPRMVERDSGVGTTIRVADLGISNDIPAVVGKVTPGLPADTAGLRSGDRVEAVDGRPIANYHELVAVIVRSAERPLELAIVRDGAPMTLTATPVTWKRKDAAGKPETVGRLGVSVRSPDPRRLGLVEAVAFGVRETGHTIKQTMAGLAMLVSTREGADQVGGPLLMAEATAEMVKFGIEPLLLWMAMLSANLGFFNLLPIPVLDGGHLTFYALEAIRRRPLSARAEALGLRFGLAVIGALVVLVNLSDLLRLGRRLLS